MTQEALKLALEVFGGNDWHDEIVDWAWADKANKAITAIKEALREHAMREVQRLGQEPVKYSDYEPDGVHHNKPAQPEQKLIGTVGDLFDDRVIAHRKLDRDLLVYIKEKNT